MRGTDLLSVTTVPTRLPLKVVAGVTAERSAGVSVRLFLGEVTPVVCKAGLAVRLRRPRALSSTQSRTQLLVESAQWSSIAAMWFL